MNAGKAVALLILPILSASALATNRYVATSGSDSGTCTNQSTPCRSINYAIGRVVDGDTIVVAPGTYNSGSSNAISACANGFGSTQILISGKSCAGQGCTITAQNIVSVENEDAGASTPPSVVLNNGNLAMCIANSPGWTIRGLKIESSGRGHYIASSDDLLLEDMVVEYTDTGDATDARIWNSDGVTLRRYVIDHVGLGNGGCLFAGEGEVGDYNNVQNLLVEDSYFGHSEELWTMDPNTFGIIARRNVFEHIKSHGLVMRGPSDLLFENNIFRGDKNCNDGTQPLTGPRLVDIYEVTDLVFRNNTVIGHGYMWQNVVKSYSMSNQCANETGGHCDVNRVSIYNNLVYDIRPLGSGSNDNFVQVLSSGSYASCSGMPIDGNLWNKGPNDWTCPGGGGSSFGSWQGSSCCGTSGADNNGTGNAPSFVNYSAQNYRAADGTAEQVNRGVRGSGDFGVARCAADDFDGNPRTDGNCDIGAFEYSGGGIPDNCPSDPTKLEPGICGCGVPDTDSDADGTADCNDQCPVDPDKTDPGQCGCGVPDEDVDGNGTLDCFDTDLPVVGNLRRTDTS